MINTVLDIARTYVLDTGLQLKESICKWGKKIIHAFKSRFISGWYVRYARNIERICLAHLKKWSFHILRNKGCRKYNEVKWLENAFQILKNIISWSNWCLIMWTILRAVWTEKESCGSHSSKDDKQGVGFTKIQAKKLWYYILSSFQLKGCFEGKYLTFNCILFKITCPWAKLLSKPINYWLGYTLEYESLLPYEIVFVLSTVA